MTFTTNAYGLGYGGAGGRGLSVVGLVNTDVHVSQRGHDGQAFGTHEQMPSASFIWVGTRLGLRLSHICPRAPTTIG